MFDSHLLGPEIGLTWAAVTFALVGVFAQNCALRLADMGKIPDVRGAFLGGDLPGQVAQAVDAAQKRLKAALKDLDRAGAGLKKRGSPSTPIRRLVAAVFCGLGGTVGDLPRHDSN